MKLSVFMLFGALAPLAAASLQAISPYPKPYHDTNADGTVTPLIRAVGSVEVGGQGIYIETVDGGYTVHKINGTYMYMELDEVTGFLIDSGLQAGRDDPEKVVGKSGKKIMKKARNKKKSAATEETEEFRRRHRYPISEIQGANGDIPIDEFQRNAQLAAPQIGDKKNLVVPFKFSDHTTRTVPSTSDIDILMNNQGPHQLCPTGSVRDVYLQSSFGQLVLGSTVANWVTLPNTEAYYADGNSGSTDSKAHEMIRDALNALDATGFDFRPFDVNVDGYIDAITFLHSGYGAERMETDAYGTYYTNRIWSHKWNLYTLPEGKWTSNDGVSVTDYHVSPSVWGISGSEIGRIGVIAHETGHFFGLPDLYDGNDSDSDGVAGSGIGSFGLMANSWGFDNSQYYPPPMSAWSKIQLGWVTPTVISAPGTYSIRQACDYPDVYMINHNFPSGEYLLIENRQQCDFDAKIEGSGGLAIFHVDDTATDNTQEGFPGQSEWPSNGNHYRVALLQADGGYDLEHGLDRGDGDDLFRGGGVNGIGPSGTSSGATYPNTKAYQGGTIVDTGICISNISLSGPTMTFTVSFDAAQLSTLTKSTTSKSKSTSSKPTPSTPTPSKPNLRKPTPPKPLGQH